MATELVDETADLIQSLKNEFKDIGERWRELRTETGRFLMHIQDDLPDAAYRMFRRWIRDNYRITLEDQTLCIRIANGEVTEELASWISPSLLNQIDTVNLPELDKEYVIYSPSSGGVVKKKARHFTREEKKVNVGPHGIRKAGEAIQTEKPLLTAMATEHRIEDKMLVLFVPNLKKEVKYKITRRLINDISAVL